jgi:cell wall-associated NlpC family hydrolase
MLAAAARHLDGTQLATPAAVQDLRQHALDAHPQECIGFLDQDGLYVRLDNLSGQPEARATADHRVIARELAAGNLRALCHSHPGGPDCPSEADMRSQAEMEVPFVIVTTNGQATAAPFAWGDQLVDSDPLVGRPFRHGVRDCYALIRMWWWRERGVLLPDYPRSWEWWLPDRPGEKDLYRRYFADAGFYRIDQRDARQGDVWFAAVRSQVPNHAGIYLDGGLVLHHPSSGLPFDPTRLSKREPIGRWVPFIRGAGDLWVRRD